MTRFRVGLLEKEWPWLVVVVLFLSAAIYLALEHYGITVAVAGQIEIAKDLIQVNGLLIAFTGIVFTGMLAEVRFRTERALQAADHERAERLERKPRRFEGVRSRASSSSRRRWAMRSGTWPPPWDLRHLRPPWRAPSCFLWSCWSQVWLS